MYKRGCELLQKWMRLRQVLNPDDMESFRLPSSRDLANSSNSVGNDAAAARGAGGPMTTRKLRPKIMRNREKITRHGRIASGGP